MQLLRLQARSKSAAEALIHGYLEAIRKEASVSSAGGENAGGLDNNSNGEIGVEIAGDVDAAERVAHRVGSPWPRHRALVVDGKTLTFILDPRSGLTDSFLELTTSCTSVLACRATPLQKVCCSYSFLHFFFAISIILNCFRLPGIYSSSCKIKTEHANFGDR